jgi:hypothetical protein
VRDGTDGNISHLKYSACDESLGSRNGLIKDLEFSFTEMFLSFGFLSDEAVIQFVRDGLRRTVIPEMFAGNAPFGFGFLELPRGYCNPFSRGHASRVTLLLRAISHRVPPDDLVASLPSNRDYHS